MKRHILKTTNWFYGLIISLLGFSQGCSSNRDFPVMYGPPPPSDDALIIISGKITDENDAPINGIEVFMATEYQPKVSTYTNSKGKYSISASSSKKDIKKDVYFRDIDGTENGGDFISQGEEVVFENKDFIQVDGQHLQGEANKTVNIVMKKKNE